MRNQNRPGQSGFSLIELIVVLGIAAVISAMSMMAFPTYTRYARAEAGTAQVLDILRSARDVAISQRRNVEVSFIGTDTIQTARVEYPSGVKTVLRTVRLENRFQILAPGSIADTPDGFGAFVPTATRMFTSEGTLVDANGDVLNGTVFIAVPGDTTSTRAVTVFGTSALLRAWKRNGTTWLE